MKIASVGFYSVYKSPKNIVFASQGLKQAKADSFELSSSKNVSFNARLKLKEQDLEEHGYMLKAIKGDYALRDSKRVVREGENLAQQRKDIIYEAYNSKWAAGQLERYRSAIIDFYRIMDLKRAGEQLPSGVYFKKPHSVADVIEEYDKDGNLVRKFEDNCLTFDLWEANPETGKMNFSSFDKGDGHLTAYAEGYEETKDGFKADRLFKFDFCIWGGKPTSYAEGYEKTKDCEFSQKSFDFGMDHDRFFCRKGLMKRGGQTFAQEEYFYNMDGKLHKYRKDREEKENGTTKTGAEYLIHASSRELYVSCFNKTVQKDKTTKAKLWNIYEDNRVSEILRNYVNKPISRLESEVSCDERFLFDEDGELLNVQYGYQ